MRCFRIRTYQLILLGGKMRSLEVLLHAGENATIVAADYSVMAWKAWSCQPFRPFRPHTVTHRG